jgi:hypothetical protein
MDTRRTSGITKAENSASAIGRLGGWVPPLWVMGGLSFGTMAYTSFTVTQLMQLNV